MANVVINTSGMDIQLFITAVYANLVARPFQRHSVVGYDGIPISVNMQLLRDWPVT